MPEFKMEDTSGSRNDGEDAATDKAAKTAVPEGVEVPTDRQINRRVVIGVGGTGLETIKRLATELKANGMKFADEKNPKVPTIVHAIFVDTDTNETSTATVDDDSAEAQKARDIAELAKMGVQVVNVHSADLNEFLVSARLEKHLSRPRIQRDVQATGAEKDGRLGEAFYLAVRGNDNPKINPVATLKGIARDWLRPENARIGKQTTLTIVGGSHGGTGPLAIQLMHDSIEALRQELKGVETAIASERIIMTAESAELDSSMGPDRQRRMNSLRTLVLVNAAHQRKGAKAHPNAPWQNNVHPTFNVLIGGKNGENATNNHYDPTSTAAAILATGIFGAADVTTRRINMRAPESEGAGGPHAPNIPGNIFSMIGASTLRTDPDNHVLEAIAKANAFERKHGLGPANMQNVAQFLNELMGSLDTEDIVTGLANKLEPPPGLTGEDFMDDEENPTGPGIHRKATIQMNDTVNGLIGKRDRELPKIRTELAENLLERQVEIQTQHGINTTIQFLENVLKLAEAVEAQAEAMLADDTSGVSQAEIDGQKARIKALSNTIKNTKLPARRLLGVIKGKERERVEESFRDQAQELADVITEYFQTVCRQTVVQQLVSRTLLDKAKQTARKELAKLRQRQGELSTERDKIVESAQGRAIRTAMDVVVKIPETVDPASVDILQLAANESVQNLLDVHSEPLSRSAHRKVGRRGETTGKANVETQTAMVTIPVRNGDSTQEALERAPGKKTWTPVAVGPKGAYSVVKEHHRVRALIDDAFVRALVEEIQTLPPTFEKAERLSELSGSGDPMKMNRDGTFLFTGQAERLLGPVFKALARAKYSEDGAEEGSGEVRECQGCGAHFYNPQKDDGNTHCPGACTELHKLETAEALRQARMEETTTTPGGKKEGGQPPTVSSPNETQSQTETTAAKQ